LIFICKTLGCFLVGDVLVGDVLVGDVLVGERGGERYCVKEGVTEGEGEEGERERERARMVRLHYSLAYSG
jgi:hypothetical protein